MISSHPAISSLNPHTQRNLIERFQMDDLGVKFSLSKEELQQISEQYQKVQELYAQFKGQNILELQRNLIDDQDLEVEEIIAIGIHALQKRFQILPYDTQLFILLGILLSPAESKGRLAQVKTGEGKSTIITLMALVLAVKGKSVDIISSSHYLSIRDQEKYAPFFKGFGIKTAHICDPEPAAEKFEANILYGMVTDFEFALIRQTIQTEEIFSSVRQNFNTVIVDEVDNLLIDTSMNSARIAHPAIKSYRSLYMPMFQFVKERRPIEELREFLSHYTPVENLSDQLLETYHYSAVMALAKKQNIDYVLKEDPTKKSKMVIQIIDKENTGRICEELRWGDGLHEFLEVKHDLLPEEETITPISMSHAVFYDQYRGKIFGLSGTLGSKKEREELQAIYQLDHFDSPVHHSFKRIDYSPEICMTQQEYNRTLIEKIRIKHDKNRPVLILCPSIQESQEIYSLCKRNQIHCQIFNEMQTEPPDTIIGQAGSPGQVTITTNNAGRGTDIALPIESLQAGGLHVILTFYPYSQRVEEQAIGRAGRQGNQGSSEILLLAEKLKFNEQKLPIEKSSDYKRKVLDYLQVQEMAKVARVSKEWKKHVYSHPLYILRFYREKTIQHQFDLHVHRAEAERVVADFTQRFWSSLKAWNQRINSPTFFQRVQQRATKSQWDSIKTITQIETAAIHAWVQHFYHPSEKLIMEGENPKIIPDLFESTKTHWESLFDESQFMEVL